MSGEWHYKLGMVPSKVILPCRGHKQCLQILVGGLLSSVGGGPRDAAKSSAMPRTAPNTKNDTA
jgi:hypothetical protein